MSDEKEKMINSLSYNPKAEALFIERSECKQKCQKYNNLPIDDFATRQMALNGILGTVGNNCYIEPHFWCDYGYNISVGENFYSNYNLVILDPAPVSFGDNVFVGPNCGFYTATHPLDHVTRNLGVEEAYPIKVGNNVWFGGNVVVMPGVTIGDNVVIGAGSVVVKDVPSNTVAVGNPCRVLRDVE